MRSEDTSYSNQIGTTEVPDRNKIGTAEVSSSDSLRVIEYVTSEDLGIRMHGGPT